MLRGSQTSQISYRNTLVAEAPRLLSLVFIIQKPRVSCSPGCSERIFVSVLATNGVTIPDLGRPSLDSLMALNRSKELERRSNNAAGKPRTNCKVLARVWECQRTKEVQAYDRL